MADPVTSESVHSEPEPARADDAASAVPGPSRIPAVLVVVATVIAVVASFTTWVRTDMLDSDAWAGISEELIADPEIQAALGVYLSNELFERVDVEAALADRLPDQLSGLAGPLAGALREPITKGFDTLLASPRFQQLWVDANRRAHEVFVAVIRDDTRPGVSAADGTVAIELGTMVRALGESAGLPASALERIPPDAGRIVVLESDQLAQIQTSVRILDLLSWFLFVVVVGLYALALVLAGRRRTHVLQLVGIALAVGGLTLLMLQAIAIRTGVDFAVRRPSNEPAARAVAQIATSLLRNMAWTGITFGLVVMVVAFLLGDQRHAVAARRRLAPAAAATGPATAGLVGLVLVIALLWWSPGGSFNRWPSSVSIVVIVVVGAVLLHRRVIDESQPRQVAIASE